MSILFSENDLSRCVCGHVCINGEDLQMHDNAEIPMLWCSNCGGEFFLDIPFVDDDFDNLPSIDYEKLKPIGKTRDLFPMDKLREYLPLVLRNLCEEDLEESFQELGEYPVYEVQPCFVEKVLGSNVIRYSAEGLNEKQIQEIKDTFIDENRRFITTKRKEVPESFMKMMEEKYGLKKSKTDLLLAEDCNSYNVREPKIPYPEWLSLDHSGVYLKCKIILQGKTVNISYWGD